ncbi:MAG: TolB family protein [Acidimicrobiales bacterium]
MNRELVVAAIVATLAVACVQDDGPAVVDSTTTSVDSTTSVVPTVDPTSSSPTPDTGEAATSTTGAVPGVAQQLGILVSVEAVDDRFSTLLFDPESGLVSELSDNARFAFVSPDLSSFVYVSEFEDRGELRIGSIDLTDDRLLLNLDRPLIPWSWSPDGGMIAATEVTVIGDSGATSAVLTIDVATGATERLSAGDREVDASEDLVLDRRPEFSADGRRLLFTDGRIVVSEPVGADPTALAFEYSVVWASFAPDGVDIAVVAYAESDDAILDLWIVPGDDTTPRRLTDIGIAMSRPVWSPTGSLLAFFGADPGTEDVALYVIDARGTALTRVTPISGSASPPVWSPDGALLAYQDGENGELFLIDPARAEPQPTGIVGTPTDWR